MTYTLKTRTVSEKQPLDSEGTFKTVAQAIEHIFSIAEFSWDEMAEALICTEGKPVYSIKFLSYKQFVITELL